MRQPVPEAVRRDDRESLEIMNGEFIWKQWTRRDLGLVMDWLCDALPTWLTRQPVVDAPAWKTVYCWYRLMMCAVQYQLIECDTLHLVSLNAIEANVDGKLVQTDVRRIAQLVELILSPTIPFNPTLYLRTRGAGDDEDTAAILRCLYAELCNRNVGNEWDVEAPSGPPPVMF